MEKEVYRPREFCILYSISRRSFYREIKAKRLPVIKRGGRTYIARKDAELWLDAQRQPRQATV